MLAKKLNKESGGDVTIESLVVTENGNYSETGKAYSPVVVNVQPTLETLNATVNGTYTPQGDGYSEVTVNVQPTLETLNATANGTYTPQGDGYSEVNVNVPLPENGYLLESASGQVVNITDAAPLYLQECKAEVEAVQDLHGYDHPWVGGAGKNKWNEETVYGYYLVESGAYFNDTSQLCSKNLIPVSPSTSYRLVGGGNSVIFYNSNQEFMSSIFITASEIFTTPSDCYYIHFNLGNSYGNVYNHDVGVIYPSSETSYEPYSNICPISGRTEEVITQKDNPTNPTVTKTYTIQLGDTVYGGTLDVTRGELRVTHELWTKNTSAMNNTENYPGWINCGIKELVGNGFDRLIENQIMNIGTDYGVNTQEHYDILYLPRDTYGKTQTEWKALAQDIEIAVELATPYTIQLTPQQIRLLEGTNNLSCNTGDLNIEYLGKGVN